MTFDAIALNWLGQEGTNQTVEHALSKSVNHFDVAPAYGDTGFRLRPKFRQHREDIFLSCKTQERSHEDARRKLDRSFDRLGVDYIDLYQVYDLEYESELDEVTADDGALAAFRETKDEGKIGHIGLTSHGNPELIRDAIDRIDGLEVLMFPLNPVVAGKDDDEYSYEGIFEVAEKTGIGTPGIKAFARGLWPDTNELPKIDRPFPNWYEPVNAPNEIVERPDFAAVQGLMSTVTPGDPKPVAAVPDAVTQYNDVNETVQRSLVERLRHDESPVPEQLHH